MTPIEYQDTTQRNAEALRWREIAVPMMRKALDDLIELEAVMPSGLEKVAINRAIRETRDALRRCSINLNAARNYIEALS